MSIRPSQSAPATAEPSRNWRNPAILLMAMAAVMQLSFAPWMHLDTNFGVEILEFSGMERGIQQSVREIPGFLSFAAVFLLLWGREQTWAYVSLLLLGGAAALTGFFPTFTGFLIITFISSVGFHYYETMHQSLSLQWLPKETAPATMGKILSAGSFAQLAALLFVLVASAWFALEFTSLFLITGTMTVLGTLVLWLAFPAFKDGMTQNKSLVLRKRYWLYYALTFIGGARRQIFIVFAGFLMVQNFEFSVPDMMLLALANVTMLMIVAPIIGKWIMRFGERNMLTWEYIGLIVVFVAYAFVDDWRIAVGLYLIDHALFAVAISMKTYFQKIADPADIAPTAGVAFTINHIAAVFIPVLFGLVWLWNPAIVFLSGAAMACCSLFLARMIPKEPGINNEFVWINMKTEAG